MESRNKLRRSKNIKTFVVAGIITFFVVFITLSYAIYCLICYAQDNKIKEIFELNTILASLDYVLAPSFSVEFDFDIMSKIAIIQVTKLWWIYCAIPFFFFMSATSEYGKEYRGVEKGGAEWSTKNDEKLFLDHTGIPMGKDFYATVTNPNIKEIARNKKSGEIDKKSKKYKNLLGSFYSPHNLNEVVIGGSGAGKSYRKIKPDIMQMNSSMILNDPKGELFANTAKLLKARGYRVSVLNMLDITLTDIAD